MSTPPSTLQKLKKENEPRPLRSCGCCCVKILFILLVLVAGIVLLVVFVFGKTQAIASVNSTSQPNLVTKSTNVVTNLTDRIPKETSPPSNAAMNKPNSTGNNTYAVGSIQGMGYYHCSADNRTKKATDIVLLHGASFTKEIWKTTGILDRLCAIPQFSTTALDFPISDGYVDLKSILHQLTTHALVTLPVTLVTPSASSWSVTDWMMHSNVDGTASQYFNTWIPVAPVALTRASNQEIVSTLRPINHTTIKVLAIYGDRDKGGAALSRRLQTLVNATLVAIPGGHACYQQSPGEFVDAIAKFFGLK